MANRREMPCRNCIYSEITVVSVYRPISPLSFYGHQANELNIWCSKRLMNIRHPYEECRHRLERQKMRIDTYGRVRIGFGENNVRNA